MTVMARASSLSRLGKRGAGALLLSPRSVSSARQTFGTYILTPSTHHELFCLFVGIPSFTIRLRRRRRHSSTRPPSASRHLVPKRTPAWTVSTPFVFNSLLRASFISLLFRARFRFRFLNYYYFYNGGIAGNEPLFVGSEHYFAKR